MVPCHSPSLLAIPGPSVIPERVLRAMHRASPNIYHGELIEMVDTLWPDLKAVARTKHSLALYIANGHGAWEAALANTVGPGDAILVLVTGRFGQGWADMARRMGVEVETIDFGKRSDADPQRLEERLRQDGAGTIKAVLTVQTDTASSVINDVVALRKAIDAAGHDALFMVDCIASLACDRFEMDDWGVDVMVSACQKGLMTPAGMAFVWFNDRAATARERVSPSQYWDWRDRSQAQIFYQKFAGTAPTHHLYGLREALDMLIKEEGMEVCWARHGRIAKAVWAAVDAWGEDCMHHNITDPTKRSAAVSAITTAPGVAGKLRAWCEAEAGLTLGIGLGMAEPDAPDYANYFRIGHMGHQHPPMTLGVLATIDLALKAQGIGHGNGAVEAAATVLAEF
ncbi:MAG: aminotransferase class V-fold PLP-dependent enzyme [Ahrensia sp.]|nr:aminotransferase class V-fold PLP-dependent enzyme [Ahrensia sp.]